MNELLNLTLQHIESDRMLIKVVDAKGGKDRYTLLSKKVLQDLRMYYMAYKPKKYLFEGEERGKKYSASSVLQIVKKSAIKSGIDRKVPPPPIL